MYKDCLGTMKEQCKNSRLPHLLMIVMHGEPCGCLLRSRWMMMEPGQIFFQPLLHFDTNWKLIIIFFTTHKKFYSWNMSCLEDICENLRIKVREVYRQMQHTLSLRASKPSDRFSWNLKTEISVGVITGKHKIHSEKYTPWTFNWPRFIEFMQPPWRPTE